MSAFIVGVLGFVTTVVSLIIGIEIGKWRYGSRSDLWANVVEDAVRKLKRADQILAEDSSVHGEIARELITLALDELRNGKQRAAEKELYEA